MSSPDTLFFPPRFEELTEMLNTSLLCPAGRAVLALALFFAIAPLTCAIAGETATGAPSAEKISAGCVEHVSKKGGYRLRAPAGWKRQPMVPGPIDMLFICKEDPSVINITWAPVDEGQDEFTGEMAAEMKGFNQSRAGGAVTSEDWREVDGARAFCLSARYNQLGVELQHKQVVFIKGGKFYSLTYTTAPELFLKNLGDFEMTVESFSIK